MTVEKRAALMLAVGVAMISCAIAVGCSKPEATSSVAAHDGQGSAESRAIRSLSKRIEELERKVGDASLENNLHLFGLANRLEAVESRTAQIKRQDHERDQDTVLKFLLGRLKLEAMELKDMEGVVFAEPTEDCPRGLRGALSKRCIGSWEMEREVLGLVALPNKNALPDDGRPENR